MFIGIFSIVIIILILFSYVKIDIKGFIENRKNKITLRMIFLFGLIDLKKEVSLLDIKDNNKDIDGDSNKDIELKVESDTFTNNNEYFDSVNIRKKLEEMYSFFQENRDLFNYFFERIALTMFNWKTEIGFEDAAITGIATGFINIFKSNIYAVLNSSKRKPKKIHFKIIPDFKEQVFKTSIHCIFTMKLGYIIIVGLKYNWAKKSSEKH